MDSKLSSVQEYALWTAAGISPDLLSRFDFGSGDTPSSVSSVGHGTAEPVALTMQQEDDRDLLNLAKATPEALTEIGVNRVATLRARWRLATTYVRIDMIPCVVELDSDYSLEGDPAEYVGTTKLTVYGDCPNCFHQHQTQDNEWTWEPRYDGSEWAVCECGAEYKIFRGVPDSIQEVL